MISVATPSRAWREPHLGSAYDMATTRLAQRLSHDLDLSAQPSESNKSRKPYQASVEDDSGSDSEHDARSPAKDGATAPAKSQASPPLSSPRPSAQASSATSTLKDGTNPPRPRHPGPRVHFSDRPTPELSASPPIDAAGYKQNVSKPRARVGDDGHTRTPAVERERIWGRLFDNRGRPTDRFRDHYRRIATYLMSSYDSRGAVSMVIPPRQLQDFFDQFSFGSSEFIPLVDVFGAQEEHVDAFYERLGCEYHLVPARTGQTPSLPALTANGFVHLMEQLARGCPASELSRLSWIMDKLPIDTRCLTADGSTEKLPRKLPRHLFPPLPEEAVQERLVAAYEAARRRGGRGAPRAIPLVIQNSVPRSRGMSHSPSHGKSFSASYPPYRHPSTTETRTSHVSGSSRRYTPRHPSRDESPLDRPRLSFSRLPPEEYPYRPRKQDRSPSPPRKTRHREREPSPPPRRRRSSLPTGSLRPSDLFTGVSSLSSPPTREPDGGHHSRHRRDSHGSREPPRQRSSASSHGSSRRYSMGSPPRMSFEGKDVSSPRRRSNTDPGPTHEEWFRERGIRT